MKNFSFFVMAFIIGITVFSQEDQTKIIGGENAHPDDFLFLAGLAYIESGNLNPENHFCGGSIIAEKWILTAAHCLYDTDGNPLKMDDLFIFLNTYNLSLPKSEREFHRIERLILHPGYNDNTLENDIALIELKTITTLTPIKLPAQNDESLMTPKRKVTIAGWGATDRNERQYPDILQKAEVEIISSTICNQRTWYNGEISSKMFCAGYESGGIDACVGDSGGPLFFEDNNTATQLGIVSWGEICGAARFPGVYTKVNEYINWIRNYTEVSVSNPSVSFSENQLKVIATEDGITLKNSENVDIQVAVYDFSGKRIMDFNLVPEQVQTKILDRGLYIIQISDHRTFIQSQKISLW
jgi:trypsin